MHLDRCPTRHVSTPSLRERGSPKPKESAMSGWSQDVRFGLRQMRTRPGFALAAVVAGALGVGMNSSIFSAVSALLLRPLPIRNVDRVVYGTALRDGWDPFATSFLDYTLYRDQARTLESVGLRAPPPPPAPPPPARPPGGRPPRPGGRRARRPGSRAAPRGGGRGRGAAAAHAHLHPPPPGQAGRLGGGPE